MSIIYIVFRNILGAVRADKVHFFFFLTYKSEAIKGTLEIMWKKDYC